MCFVLRKKTPFLELGAVHQFAYGVDQFSVLSCGFVTMFFLVLKSFIFIGSQIGSHGVFGSILMHHNFSG
jgi:hypothetical protein